jgi:hypothetical protein
MSDQDQDQDWGKMLRDIASDLGGIKGQKKQIKMLLDAADMIDRASPAARPRIAQALRVRHPKLTMLPRLNASIYGDRPGLPFSAYPSAPLAWQVEIVLGKTPAEVTGLTAREAHVYLSAKPGSVSPIPALWVIGSGPAMRALRTGAVIGIDSVPIARWYLQRWDDPEQQQALLKERVERGPAGEEIRGRFIDRMDELVEGDLTPSVRKTFENASNRMKIEFEEEMLRPKNQQILAPVPAWYTEMPGITLLDHGAQLVMEGREMKHCVATYIGRVRRGLSTIFSIRVPTEDGQVLRSTVELKPKTAEIIQHKGVGNARPPAENMKALAHALEVWLKPAAEQETAFWAKVAEEPARQGNPVPADLHDRIARDLGWPVADTYKFSLPTLRELVRDYELREEITQAMIDGHHLAAVGPRRGRR